MADSAVTIRLKKKRMIEALTESLGIVTIACKKTGTDRNTHYNWYHNDKEYKEAVDALSEVSLDFAESKLLEKIEEKDTTAIIFYLKTKGKSRGYVERLETDHLNSLPGTVNIVVSSKENAAKLDKFLYQGDGALN